MNNIIKEPPQEYFGGDWTFKKLEVLKKYLSAYTTALKNQPFKLGYIDAFAGTGNLNIKKQNFLKNQHRLFELTEDRDAKEYLKGSVKIALETDPLFDKYIFIEQDKKKTLELEKMVDNEFPHLKEKVTIKNEEANKTLQDLCNEKKWEKHRAVVFLDPFGMDVEWETVEAIAKTQAIDLWVLFSLGGSMRMLMKERGQIPLSWSNVLDKTFGTNEWSNEFYETESKPSLFKEYNQETKKIADFTKIAKYYIQRLNGIFAGVVKEPLLLYNSKNNPIFLLCFAAGNPKGATIAVKIAESVMSK